MGLVGTSPKKWVVSSDYYGGLWVTTAQQTLATSGSLMQRMAGRTGIGPAAARRIVHAKSKRGAKCPKVSWSEADSGDGRDDKGEDEGCCW